MVPVERAVIFICFILTTNCFKIQENYNEFAISLYNILVQTNDNIVFSPLSAHIGLVLCLQGAAGKTRDLLVDALKFPYTASYLGPKYRRILSEFNKTSDDLALHIANNIYVKTGYGLKPTFQIGVKEYFMADVEMVDFSKSSSTARQINEWVSAKTHSKIKDIISEQALDEETRIVLVNAIYFKGTWEYPFPVHQTRVDKFYLSQTQNVKCKMMRTVGNFYYAENDELDSTILRMPYANSNLSFIIILPNRIYGIQNLELRLARTDLVQLAKNMFPGNVHVSLPKFKLEMSMDLKEPLRKLGFENIFNEKANFSLILNSDEPLKISKILHTTFIDVNENGTEAAAATSVVIRTRRSLDLQQYHFYANRPFMFYIMDSNSMLLLFLGRLTNPDRVIVHDEL